MIDWCKHWVRNEAGVGLILNNDLINFKGLHWRNTGEIIDYPVYGKWDEWEFEIKSPTWLEMTGSHHKFWNNGTNGNDFFLKDLLSSVIKLCNQLKVNPYNFTTHNIEFGVNIRPKVNASIILQNIICFKNRECIKVINEGKYFIEFEMDDYYLKIYDKGLQARTVWGMDIGNVLRFEIKARNSSYPDNAKINTLVDLLNPNKLQILGKKINKVFKSLIFDDPTIDPDIMTPSDKIIYLRYRNPREWLVNGQGKTSTITARENRFREVVAKYGSLNLHNTLSLMIADKWDELLAATPDVLQDIDGFLEHCKLCGISYLRYTHKTHKVSTDRKCLACGKDISDQSLKSKYCSSKRVGAKKAHKCRDVGRKVEKMEAMGVLFDIKPFITIDDNDSEDRPEF